MLIAMLIECCQILTTELDPNKDTKLLSQIR